jgi:hypothetical protein
VLDLTAFIKVKAHLRTELKNQNASKKMKGLFMLFLKICFCIILFSLLLSLPTLPLDAEDHPGHMSKSPKDAGAGQTPDYPTLAAPGKKVSIGNGSYLIYGFDKKPKLGTIIMKVEIFNQEGRKDTSPEVKADAGMPSMRGAHETGDRPFVLSKKGDYLLPINIVMPGDWEIRLTIIKGGKVIFRGRYNFDV